MPAFQPIGVLAVILDGEGRVLVLDHVTRAHRPLGLPGGWLSRAERPEDGLRREVAEELRVEVDEMQYLLSAPHRNAEGRPYGLTLVYSASVVADVETHLSWEVRRSHWLSVSEAVERLRDFEAAAVRLAAERRG